MKHIEITQEEYQHYLDEIAYYDMLRHRMESEVDNEQNLN